MKFYTFVADRKARLGVEQDGQIVDLGLAYEKLIAAKGPPPGWAPTFPANLPSLIRAGDLAMVAAREALAFAARRPPMPTGEYLSYPLDEVGLLPPIPRPGKILCVDLVSHANEASAWFNKLPSSVIGPGAPILIPPGADHVTGVFRLVAVIGRRMRRVSPAEATAGVFGLTILNDIFMTSGDLSQNQPFLAKNLDTFCPLGPCVTTSDGLPAPGGIAIRVFLNNELTASGLIENPTAILAAHVSRLSGYLTLEAGDLVSTPATAPEGAVLPTVELKPGDLLRVEADGIGVLENMLVSDPAH
ncbi:MAG TPA: fumarylacetoacetate hydrolase family protein [Verrucomicrobiae bacterium]|nr:fumarylacetoacetate hydrolase family protein [Verrucomicrobiae bacterium]